MIDPSNAHEFTQMASEIGADVLRRLALPLANRRLASRRR